MLTSVKLIKNKVIFFISFVFCLQLKNSCLNARGFPVGHQAVSALENVLPVLAAWHIQAGRKTGEPMLQKYARNSQERLPGLRIFRIVIGQL